MCGPLARPRGNGRRATRSRSIVSRGLQSAGVSEPGMVAPDRARLTEFVVPGDGDHVFLESGLNLCPSARSLRPAGVDQRALNPG